MSVFWRGLLTLPFICMHRLCCTGRCEVCWCGCISILFTFSLTDQSRKKRHTFDILGNFLPRNLIMQRALRIIFFIPYSSLFVLPHTTFFLLRITLLLLIWHYYLLPITLKNNLEVFAFPYLSSLTLLNVYIFTKNYFIIISLALLPILSGTQRRLKRYFAFPYLASLILLDVYVLSRAILLLLICHYLLLPKHKVDLLREISFFLIQHHSHYWPFIIAFWRHSTLGRICNWGDNERSCDWPSLHGTNTEPLA